MKFSRNLFVIKITNRKFWVALAGLAASVMAFMKFDSNTIIQVTAIIGALGSVMGYLISNGLKEDTMTDKNEEENKSKKVDTSAEDDARKNEEGRG
ncbi:MAG: hypothetical protein AB7E42_04935 [Anaerotignaceae bacterium]